MSEENNVRYESVTEKEKAELKELLLRNIDGQFQVERYEESGINWTKYKVTLQNIVFETDYTDDEMEQIADIAVDLLEEMKQINNSGVGQEKYIELHEKSGYAGEDSFLAKISSMLQFFKASMTDEFAEILEVRVTKTCRVGGAYWMLLARPELLSAIDAVYEKIADHFDDEELYLNSLYFLFRSIMRVHSVERS